MKKILVVLSIVFMLTSVPALAAGNRPLRPGDIQVPDGYMIEPVVEGLAAPTMVSWDDQGRMLIAESGYDASGGARVTRIENDGTKTVLTKEGIFGKEIPVTSVAFNDGNIYVVHASTVSIVQTDGTLKDIITGLPGGGDHQADTILFKDGYLYLSIGTMTNSAVVGPDNAVFGWLKDPAKQQLHDVPCQDVTLNGETFSSENVIGDKSQTVQTSPYSAFGTAEPAGTVIKGDVKCNGAVLRARPDGSDLQVVAWGFRNPYGMAVGPDGSLYVTMHGYDARGTRQIENAWDCFYKVEEGAWYGFPDFVCDVPVTDHQFKPEHSPQPGFILSSHPSENPPKPIAKFSPHEATNGFAFAPNADWGKPTDAFIALFGDFTPATGTVARPQGVKIVKLDTTTGQVTDFITNKLPGQASRHSAGGLEHPSAVAFGPDGAMYITDWGIARISVEGLKLAPETGVVWKVVRQHKSNLPAGPSAYITWGSIILLGAIAFFIANGTVRQFRPRDGLIFGAIAGLGMAVVTIIISVAALQLPWYAPPRVLATMVMGRNALANILKFDFLSTLIGAIVLLVLTAILGLVFVLILKTRSSIRTIIAGLVFGLAVWALLQYLVLPLAFPLITEKGFPPLWYAVSFGFWGLALGVLLSLATRRRTETTIVQGSD